MPSPATYNLVVPQATTFTFQFQILENNTPWNLTNYTATMTVRPFAGSTTTTLLATTANGKIVLDGINGRATVTFSATDTNIMFIIPIPPTSKEIADMDPKSRLMVWVVCKSIFLISLMSRILKDSLSSYILCLF